jgi:hypothetical protein
LIVLEEGVEVVQAVKSIHVCGCGGIGGPRAVAIAVGIIGIHIDDGRMRRRVG